MASSMVQDRVYSCKATATERDEFVAMVVSYSDKPPRKAAMIAAELMRLARRHDSLSVAECNRELLPRERSAMTKCRQRIVHCAATIHACLNIVVVFGGDPRGYTVKVHWPNGEYNTWGGKESGYGIPVSR